jgi:ribonucleoside-diphosphate reductase alpha chain
MVLEISVMMAQFPSKEIAERSYEYRTLGLGYANIGGLLMTMGIPYDSTEGRAIAGALTAIMTGVSYATSAEMAAELGPFPGYKKNAKHMLRVIRNHRRAAHGETQGYEGLSVNPVALDHASCPAGPTSFTRAKAPGTRRSRSARSMATATPRPPSSRRPARSASSWIATPPASSLTSRW